ncbi:hypothetical protein ABR737_28720 [Streptomyces sp. Edi2]|uniref:hypothetical protein n=1 Tax=Streptomyces sp. Edi2 TaxID=3162528 RepID=UPI00330605D5
MPSHARLKSSRIPRTLLRAGLVISAAGAAIAAGGAATASAAPAAAERPSDTGATASALTGALLNSAAGLSTVKNLPVNPLANTPVDPLANTVSTQIADFKPVSTSLLTGALSHGGALRDLPLVGTLTRVLPG